MSRPRHLSLKLQTLYGGSEEHVAFHLARYDRLDRIFSDSFDGPRAQYFVRAPGRVNLIGEHTDYNGYPVMPMALDRDIVFAMSPTGNASVELINEDAQFGRRAFSAEFPVKPYERGDWGNYVKAAVQGLLEAGLVDPANMHGFRAAVSGSIPESAGLSSSSAMVVVSALAFLAANDVQCNRNVLADILARAERYVGSEGGGMDQAISLLAEPGHALRIDFFPLRTEPVPLNGKLTIVVCNSLIRAPKSESVRYAYNRRVIECRLATALLAKAIGERTGRQITAARLADLSAENTGLLPADIDAIASTVMGTSPLSLGDVAKRLNMTPAETERAYCMQRDETPLAEPGEGFKIWQRYKHVVTEAGRVGFTVTAFKNGDVEQVGVLMNQSHASCRDDYEISCPELDVLVSTGLESGGVGARLTGAGFGGCTVHTVPTEKVAGFLRNMEASYYNGYVIREKGRPFVPYKSIHDVMFPCRAAGGADFWLID